MTKRGLGKGLGALMTEQEDDDSRRSNVRYAEVPVDLIRPNPRQPRQVFDEEELAELVHSIKEIGLLQPIVVRASEPGFEVVAGERRLRAARAAGFEFVPALIRVTSDDDLLRDALLENLHRSALNPLEEAAAYSQLLSDFGCTTEELAARLGRSRPQVANTIRLLRLPVEVQRRVAAGVLSAGHARALLALPVEQMSAMASRIVAEGLSVRAVEELVAAGPIGERVRQRRPRGRAKATPELAEFSERLEARLDTRVKVELGQQRGRIVIEVASLEDLARVTDLIVAPKD